MKLGILKTDSVQAQWVADFGEYPDMFVALLSREDPDLTFVVYDVENEHYPDDIDEVDAYLITGSKCSVYDEQRWISTLASFVCELHQRKKKLLGICFGHQMVAHALGGRVGKSDKGWGVGIHSYRFPELPTWHDQLDPEFNILVSHQDQVMQPAEGAKVIAGSGFCDNAVCQLDDHILTFQGHPEFVAEYSAALMTFRAERIGEADYRAGMDSLAVPTQGDRVARWMLAFLKQ